MRSGDLSRFLGAVAAAYPEDGTRPGIVMSDLGKTRGDVKLRYYCSVKRYRSGMGSSGEVVVSAYAKTADLALAGCREAFVKLWAPLVNEVARLTQ